MSLTFKEFKHALIFYEHSRDKLTNVRTLVFNLVSNKTETDAENALIEKVGNYMATDRLLSKVIFKNGDINKELVKALGKVVLNPNISTFSFNNITCSNGNAMKIGKALKERSEGLAVSLTYVKDDFFDPIFHALSRKKASGFELGFCSAYSLQNRAMGRMALLGSNLVEFSVYQVCLNERLIESLARMIPHLTSCSFFGLGSITSDRGARARSRAFSLVVLGLLKRKKQPANFRLDLKHNELRNLPGILLARLFAKNYCVTSANFSRNKFKKNTMKALFNGFHRNQHCSRIELRQVRFKNLLLGPATLSTQDSPLKGKILEMSGNFATTPLDSTIPPGSGVRLYEETVRQTRPKAEIYPKSNTRVSSVAPEVGEVPMVTQIFNNIYKSFF